MLRISKIRNWLKILCVRVNKFYSYFLPKTVNKLTIPASLEFFTNFSEPGKISIYLNTNSSGFSRQERSLYCTKALLPKCFCGKKNGYCF